MSSRLAFVVSIAVAVLFVVGIVAVTRPEMLDRVVQSAPASPEVVATTATADLGDSAVELPLSSIPTDVEVPVRTDHHDEHESDSHESKKHHDKKEHHDDDDD